VFALALLALTVLDVRRPLLRPVRRMYAAVAFAALATSALSAVAMDIARIRHRDMARQAEQAQLDELVAAVHRHTPPGGSLYIFSYTIESGFPLVNYSGVRWASRFPHLWIIEAVYQDQLHRPSPLRFRSREEMGPAERYLNDAVYEDLVRYRPDVLMVLKHARDIPQNAQRRVDYVGYFGRDPRIAEALRQYRLAEEVGQYLLFVRAASPRQPGLAPTSEPGRYDVVGSGTSVGGQALVGDRSFLLKAILFLLLAVPAYLAERRRSKPEKELSSRAKRGI
jgi:hypothetical protein